MRLDYFYGTIVVKEKDGYGETLSFGTDKTGGLTFRYPYGDNTPDEAEAISQFIKTVNEAYNRLTNQINNVNRDLHLEQYAPQQSTEVSASESTEVSAVPQSSRLGGKEEALVAHSEAEQERLDTEEESEEEL